MRPVSVLHLYVDDVFMTLIKYKGDCVGAIFKRRSGE